MNKKIILWSIISALAGFLFGFDTVVISGADKKLQLLWHTTDAFHGAVVMGMALWGTVLGAIFGGKPLDAFGRKKTLIAIGILFSVSALGTAFANDPYTFAFFRFLGGIAKLTLNRSKMLVKIENSIDGFEQCSGNNIGLTV